MHLPVCVRAAAPLPAAPPIMHCCGCSTHLLFRFIAAGRVTNLYLCCQSAAGVTLAPVAFKAVSGFILLASTFDGRYSSSKLPSLEDWGRCGALTQGWCTAASSVVAFCMYLLLLHCCRCSCSVACTAASSGVFAFGMPDAVSRWCDELHATDAADHRAHLGKLGGAAVVIWPDDHTVHSMLHSLQHWGSQCGISVCTQEWWCLMCLFCFCTVAVSAPNPMI